MADEVLQQGVRGITDLMVMPGLVNLDFADVKSVMRDAGKAMMGTGEAEGEGRALAAAQKAIANPLLDGVSMAGAKGVIISITGGEDMGLLEVEEAGNHIRELVDPDANIIWGSAFNEELNGKIRVSVVATGLEPGSAMAGAAQPAARPFSFQARPAPTPAPVIAAASYAAAPIEDAVLPVIVDDAVAEPTPAPGFAAFDEEPLTLEAPDAIAGAADDDLELADIAEPADDADDDLVLEAVDGDDADPAVVAAATTDVDEAAPRVAPGATLFERMSRLSRGSDATDETEEKDESAFPSIPRFLGRQSNQ